MSSLNNFLSRIQSDYGFYLRFRNNREKALAVFELTPEERAVLADFEKGTGECGRSAFASGMSPNSTSSVHYSMRESGNVQFDRDAFLARPKIKETITQIREAGQPYNRRIALRTLIGEL
jgi:hypothetical protein